MRPPDEGRRGRLLAPDLRELLGDAAHDAVGRLRPGGGVVGAVEQVAELARRAGHSVAVLFRFYAKILKSDQAEANRRIAAGLEADE